MFSSKLVEDLMTNWLDPIL